MSAPYDPSTIANRFLGLAKEDSKKLTPMQLIKLAYITHGFSLAIFKRPLLTKAIEAWRYGPVIPSLYDRLKQYGSRPVDGQISQSDSEPRNEALEEDDDKLVKAVFSKYGKLTGVQLSYLTHKPGTPWALNYRPDVYGIEIDNQQIRSHYEELLRKPRSAAN
jgi:uncharacterized phage-associated protein